MSATRCCQSGRNSSSDPLGEDAVLDVVAHLADQEGHAGDGSRDLRVGLADGRARHHPDVQRARALGDDLPVGPRRRGRPVRSPLVDARHGVEHGRGVGDAAGDGPARVEDLPVRLPVGVGDAPPRGLDPEEVAERGGDAD